MFATSSHNICGLKFNKQYCHECVKCIDEHRSRLVGEIKFTLSEFSKYFLTRNSIHVLQSSNCLNLRHLKLKRLNVCNSSYN